MLKTMIILLLVIGVIFCIDSLPQGHVIDLAVAAAAADNESFLRVVDHKCIKEMEILNCSGTVNNEGSTSTNLVELIIYLKNGNGKITNMIETTTRPFLITPSGHGIYNITVSQSRLTPDWASSGAFAFSR